MNVSHGQKNIGSSERQKMASKGKIESEKRRNGKDETNELEKLCDNCST